MVWCSLCQLLWLAGCHFLLLCFCSISAWVAGEEASTMASVIRRYCSCYHPGPEHSFLVYSAIATLGIKCATGSRPVFRSPICDTHCYNLVVFVCVIAIGFRRRQAPKRIDDHPVIWLVPTYFHVYFIAWLFIAGFCRETFWLLAVSLLNAAVGIAVHQWGSLIRKKLEMLTMSDVAVET